LASLKKTSKIKFRGFMMPFYSKKELKITYLIFHTKA